MAADALRRLHHIGYLTFVQVRDPDSIDSHAEDVLSVEEVEASLELDGWTQVPPDSDVWFFATPAGEAAYFAIPADEVPGRKVGA